ncbi:hypothetical protein EVAR_82167_1 [Eumeta japonica]|uniref:Nucleic-acid-binding protein from transposon X-element n=1 Tax=Eumeta variegata TaxID=151549 RepID=A0A4C1U1V2_EUMVA|nr:hypothetical protein EVAR_82167_1 [Eumeta japonica]
MKAAYHTHSLKEEREFRVVLKGFSLEEVKTDLLAQKFPCGRPVALRIVTVNRSTSFWFLPTHPLKIKKALCVKCLGDHGTTVCTRNKDTDNPPGCVLCNTSGHTANYLGCPRAPKKYPLPNRNNRVKNNSPTDKATTLIARASGL